MRRMFILVWCMVLLVSACGGGDDNTPEPAPPQPSPTPFVNPTLPDSVSVLPTAVVDTNTAEMVSIQVIQGVADWQPVHIWLDDRQIAAAIAPFELSRQAQVTAGEHNLRVTEVTSRGQTDIEVFYETSVTVVDGDILVLSGGRDNIQVYHLNHAVEPLPLGQSQLQLVNYVANDTPAAIILNNEGLASVERTGQSSPLIDLVPDSDTFYVLVNGVLAERLNLTLEQGLLYTLVVVGSADHSATLVLETETPPQTAIRITNAAPDAPPLRFVLENRLIAESLAFGQTQDFQLFDSGEYIVNILEAGTDVVLVGSTRLRLPPYVEADVVIYGRDDDLQIGVFEMDSTPVNSGDSRFTLINAAIGVDIVKMTTISGDELGLSARYGRAASLDMSAITAEYLFFDANDEIVENVGRALTMQSGRSYVYIVTGTTDGPSILLESDVRTAVVDASDGEPSSSGSLSLAQVYVVNLYQQPIRLDFNGETQVFGLAYLTISPPFTMPIDYYPIQLYNSTTGELLLESDVLMRLGEQTFTIYVVDATTIVTNGEIESLPTALEARIRFFHAAQGISPVYIGTTDPDDDMDATLTYGEVSGIFDVSAGINGFEILDRETLALLAEYPDLRVEGGQVYDMILVNRGDGTLDLKILERQP
ncbi:MAG: DUF4397 domain-containing protein [Anaerolineales bacterium]|nr:DUF4397 domain-containing protein [Anaerolineales bacterium]